MSTARRPDLRWDLAARVLALTGRRISSEDVYADDRYAVVGVDGATLRLYRHGSLVLVRHCDYCGIGHFESPEIKDLADLGYALSAWLPLHEDCENHAAEDLADWRARRRRHRWRTPVLRRFLDVAREGSLAGSVL